MLKLLWLKWLRLNAQVRYENICRIEAEYRADLRRIEQSRLRAQVELEACHRRVRAAELARAVPQWS